ncbi:Wd Repeat And Hmg-Box Dna-Binding Protein 1 [Manis pentadactyla]|nr:Wd Repeat And Hmg-Box Dna-Binding Protein 1 [Manis pentadactyla]
MGVDKGVAASSESVYSIDMFVTVFLRFLSETLANIIMINGGTLLLSRSCQENTVHLTMVVNGSLLVTSQEDDGVSNSGVDVEVLQDPAAVDEWSYDDGSEIRLFAGSW